MNAPRAPLPPRPPAPDADARRFRHHDHTAVLHFIVEYKQAHDGISPTIREIGQVCGISSTSVVQYILRKLERKELIRFIGGVGHARNIAVTGGRWYMEDSIRDARPGWTRAGAGGAQAAAPADGVSGAPVPELKWIVVSGKWPEGISDGLIGLCAICHCQDSFDYRVDSDFWQRVVPEDCRRDIVCLPCLDRLADAMSLDVSMHIELVQFTGIGKTVVLEPKMVYLYDSRGKE